MRAPIRIACLLAVVVLVASCLAVGPQEETRLVWHQVPLPAPPPATDPVDAAVVLRLFSQDGALDRDEIRYRTSDVAGGYWPDNLWAQPVSGMVRDALQRDLELWGGCRRVLLLENAGQADLVVTGEVHRFEEADGAAGWAAVVEITLEATRASSGLVVWHRRIRAEEPCQEKTVEAVVRALGVALGRVAAEFREGLAEAAR